MRRLSVLAALVVAFAALFTTGCQTGSSGPGLGRMTGVVEIYRVTPPGSRTLVGYMSIDPANPDTSIWLLAGSEEAPVMPDPTVAGETIEFVNLDIGPMNGPDLCLNYGGTLGACQIWTLRRDPPAICGSSGD